MNELKRFKAEKPDAGALRQKYPDLAKLLYGEFAARPTVYDLDEGTVVSWELLQRKKKNPTYGRIPVGRFAFPTDYIEEVTVLEGRLEAEVGGCSKVLYRFEKVVAPADSLLKLVVRDEPVIYFCEYKGNGA